MAGSASEHLRFSVAAPPCPRQGRSEPAPPSLGTELCSPTARGMSRLSLLSLIIAALLAALFAAVDCDFGPDAGHALSDEGKTRL